MVGSIGVVAEIPNVHRLLKKNDVDVEVITAGRYKRTLTVLGENTDEGRRKFTEELEDLHVLFQEFVNEQRPGVELEKVATGEAWYGRRAIELNLVDEIATSDEYLMRGAARRRMSSRCAGWSTRSPWSGCSARWKAACGNWSSGCRAREAGNDIQGLLG